jgi:hypothetical protein
MEKISIAKLADKTSNGKLAEFIKLETEFIIQASNEIMSWLNRLDIDSFPNDTDDILLFDDNYKEIIEFTNDNYLIIPEYELITTVPHYTRLIGVWTLQLFSTHLADLILPQVCVNNGFKHPNKLLEITDPIHLRDEIINGVDHILNHLIPDDQLENNTLRQLVYQLYYYKELFNNDLTECQEKMLIPYINKNAEYIYVNITDLP